MSPQERLRQIESELSQIDGSLGVSSMGSPQMPANPNRLAEVEAELSQIDEALQPPEQSTARFIGEQLAKGAINLSDLLPFVSSMNAEIPNPKGGPSSRVYPSMTKDILPAVGIDINTQAEDTGLKRIAGHGLRALPSAVLGGPTGVLRNLGLAGFSGLGSGSLQEMGVNPLVADITSGLATAGLPAAGRGIAKGFKNVKNALNHTRSAEKAVQKYMQESIGEENLPQVIENLKNKKNYQTGYEPTTAEVADNAAISSIARGEEGIPTSGISEKMGKNADILNRKFESIIGEPGMEGVVAEEVARNLNNLEKGVSSNVSALGERGSAETAGSQIKTKTKSELSSRKKVRHEASHPLYEEVRGKKEPLPIKSSKNFIKEESEKVAGPLLNDLNQIKRELRPPLTRAERDYANNYKVMTKDMKKQGYSEAAIDALEKPKSLNPTTGKVSAVRTLINDKIKKFGTKEPARRNQMERLLKHIDEDLSHVATQKQADVMYKKLSPDVNEIELNPTLKKVIKSERGQDALSDSRVANLVTAKGPQSVDDAKALMKVIGKDKEAMKATQEYINDYAIKSITDHKTGKVLPHLIEKLKQNHPGFEVLYPDLFKTKLKNVSNARVAADRYYRNASAKAATDYDHYLGEFTGKTGNSLENSLFRGDTAKNVRDLNEAVSASPEAQEGVRRLVVNKLYKGIQNASKEGSYRTLSYDKLRRFKNQNPGVLEEVLTTPQQQFLNEFSEIMEGKNIHATKGAEKGSPTQQRARTHAEFKSKTSASFAPNKVTRYFLKDWIQKNEQKALDVLHKFLLDQDYAHELLNKSFKDQASMNSFLNDIAKTSTAAVLSRKPEEKKEKE